MPPASATVQVGVCMPTGFTEVYDEADISVQEIPAEFLEGMNEIACGEVIDFDQFFEDTSDE